MTARVIGWTDGEIVACSECGKPDDAGDIGAIRDGDPDGALVCGSCDRLLADVARAEDIANGDALAEWKRYGEEAP